jgi:hypothetical protein
MDWKARLPVLSAALWWGSLSAIGFLAVPLLFQNAASPAVAGNLAAKLFSAQCWLGLACGLFVLMGARDEDGTPSLGWAGGAVAYVLLGMLAALLQEFVVAPRIQALYALQWLCALVVLWKCTTPRLTPPASS